MQKIKIIVDCGSASMKITPATPDVLDELEYIHRSYGLPKRPPDLPAHVYFRAKRKMVFEKKLLYIPAEDNSVISHSGSLRRVMGRLTRLGIPYEIFKIGSWATPTINPGVVAGLWDNQVDAMSFLLYSAEYGGAMVEAATGTGKTRVILAIIKAFIDKRVVVATKAVSVIRGLYKNLTELLGPEAYRVGISYGGHKSPNQITICSLGTTEGVEPDETDVLIVDECHTTAGDASAQKVMNFHRAIRYGLSGTIVDRSDGRDRLLEAIYGPIVYTFTDQEAEESGKVCPIKAYFLEVPDGPMVEQMNPPTRERHGIWRNKFRNALAKQVVDSIPADQQVLVFVRTMEHLKLLTEKDFKDFEVCHGELNTKDREAIEKRFISGEAKRVISTDCLSTGVDPANLMVMIDLSAIHGDATLVQKRGRLRRWAPGKTHGVLVNFMDNWSEKLHKKATVRAKEHQDRGDQLFLNSRPEQIEFVDLTQPPEMGV